MAVGKKADTKSKYYKSRAIDVAHQREHAYQKQTGINENRRKPAKKNTTKAGKARYYKSVGLGFKTPKEAINGRYIDKKCPFTGNVSIRGRIIRCQVHKSKTMKNTIIIRRNYLHWAQKYQRYMKRHKHFTVHCSPAFTVRDGDDVVVGQCRPLSKCVRYNVLQHIPRSSQTTTGKTFKKH